MIRTNFLTPSGNRTVTTRLGSFSVVEYNRDMSVTPDRAETEYFASRMNIRKKQLAVSLHGTDVIVQSGAMQWMAGAVRAETNIRSAGDFAKKILGSKVTGETAMKPRYSGEGLLVLEPTDQYLLLQEVSEWGEGMVIEDGCFLACEGTVNLRTTARKTLSSTVLGGEGFFNSMLSGHGVAALESRVPPEELVLVELSDDTLRIDGDIAMAWSRSLQFTVERTTGTLLGSAVSGEGFVNVYRGTGKVLMAPLRRNDAEEEPPEEPPEE